ncbi:MAG: hypothetical protein GOV15_01315, partial [Candidatus Diapherotrites archaeon]|nr:hypothetical protein [Candidatus Diapherotrites archaeon]
MKLKILLLLSLLLFAPLISAEHQAGDGKITIQVTSGEPFVTTLPFNVSLDPATTAGLLNNGVLSPSTAYYQGIVYQDSDGYLYSITEDNYYAYKKLVSPNATDEEITTAFRKSIINNNGFPIPRIQAEDTPDDVLGALGFNVNHGALREVGQIVQMQFNLVGISSGNIVFKSFINGSWGKAYCYEQYPVTPRLLGHDTTDLKADDFLLIASPTPPDSPEDPDILGAEDLGKNLVVYNSAKCSLSDSGELSFRTSGFSRDLTHLGDPTFPTAELVIEVVENETPVQGLSVIVSRLNETTGSLTKTT